MTDSIHIVSSDVFVTPSGMKPASISRCAAGAVVSERRSRSATMPAQLGIPRSAIDSLIVHGTPRNGGSSSPGPAAAIRSSAASASASPSAKRSHASAFVRGWQLCSRQAWASTTSRADSSRARIAAARSRALRSVVAATASSIPAVAAAARQSKPHPSLAPSLASGAAHATRPSLRFA